MKKIFFLSVICIMTVLSCGEVTPENPPQNQNPTEEQTPDTGDDNGSESGDGSGAESGDGEGSESGDGSGEGGNQDGGTGSGEGEDTGGGSGTEDGSGSEGGSGTDAPEPEPLTVITSMLVSAKPLMGDGWADYSKYEIEYEGREPVKYNVYGIDDDGYLKTVPTSVIVITKDPSGDIYTLKQSGKWITDITLEDGVIKETLEYNLNNNETTVRWRYDENGQVLEMSNGGGQIYNVVPFENKCYPGTGRVTWMAPEYGEYAYSGNMSNITRFDYGMIMDFFTELSRELLLLLGWTGVPSQYIVDGYYGEGGGDTMKYWPAPGVTDSNNDGYPDSITSNTYRFSFTYKTIE